MEISALYNLSLFITINIVVGGNMKSCDFIVGRSNGQKAAALLHPGDTRDIHCAPIESFSDQ